MAKRVLFEIHQGFLGESSAAAGVREQIADFLARYGTKRPPPPILLRGEVGVGKSLLARLIHQVGPRRDSPFVVADLPSIPLSLMESQLFGNERGAFPDARRSEPGLFQAANRATIFLDEVRLLCEGLQAKLLSVIEERTVRRLGGTRDEPVDVWIIAATNADLRGAVQHQLFREDLYQRLGELDSWSHRCGNGATTSSCWRSTF